MRKVLVMTAALFAFTFAGAQQAIAQQNMVGIKGGFVAADLNADNVEEAADLSSATGFGVGAFLQVMVAPNVSIQPEALYLMKGGKDDTEDAEIELSYLQVPILVQYHIPAVGVSPRIFAGPSIAFELACDISVGDLEASCEDDELNTKSADFGVVFGAGVDIPAGGVVVTLDGRYDLGVSNILDASESEDVSAKNRSWEFFAGIGFPFGP